MGLKNKIRFATTNKFEGKEYINFGKNSRFGYCNIIIHGNNNKVIFGENCKIRGLNILIEGDNNTIEFGDRVTVNASKLKPTVINAIDGSTIKIGSDSLLSENIEMHSSDYHGIYSSDGKRINPEQNITIGEHVWIGLRCIVLKGASIAKGSVVGAGSLVTGEFDEENVIIAGNPAKVIKSDIRWSKERKENLSV